MKKLLLGSSAILAAGAAIGVPMNPASAADGIKLGVGGFFKTAYMVVIDDDDEGELGNERNTDGFFSDAEVHFTGSTVLDNGLEIGARVELEGETATDNEGGDQIDEAWIYFSGGFGEVRIGSDDDALANSCIVPPGGTGNFSAFSPNQWGANVGAGFFFGATSNSICTGVDERGDAQKIVYITPNFAGFQLTVSYTPSGGDETHVDGVGPHTGMPVHGFGESRHNTSAYATYSYEGESWGLTAGLGGSFEGHVEQGNFFSPASFDEQDFYQAGLNLTFGNFAIGVAGEYYNDLFSRDVVALGENDTNSWVFGVGAAYTMDMWVLGAQYSHREDDIDVNDGPAYPSEDIDYTQDRVVLTAVYALGPGIQVDGELGYTWTDADPDDFVNPSVPDGAFDYDGFEFGIGTAITF